MRLLLVSDTHGKLDMVNRLARATGADAVVHAGDFGFYDEDSMTRLSIREVALHILHSGLPKEAIDAARRMRPAELVEFARENVRPSEFLEYLSGARCFDVPVYAVWGNHEDKAVVEALRGGSRQVANLHLLDESRSYRVGGCHIFGLGGNVLVGPKLFQRPLAGGGGRIWSTLSQFGRLLETSGTRPEAGTIRILVTHVSPGKQPLVGRLAAHLRADFMVSGHMGSPHVMVWNEFAIRELRESEAWLDSIREPIERAWAEAQDDVHDAEERRRIEVALAMVRELPRERIRACRGAHEPAWYRGTFAINLPDAPVGHAVLDGDQLSVPGAASA